MSTILTFTTAEVYAGRDAVLENQGIPRGKSVSRAIEDLYTAARVLLTQHAAPAGVLREITRPEFAAVYQGAGRNDSQTPVADIFPRAEALTLFAVTLGPAVSHEIARLFASGGFALGAMLDAAASAAADQLVQVVQRRLARQLAAEKRSTPETAVLAYSPGYCGWHISGQRKLFDFLQPEPIGVTLSESFLMQPLKSVSGVVLAGPREIHRFEMSYPCCARCQTRACRGRIRDVFAQRAADAAQGG